jgi:uncharacterized integral membrane protein (TIGR00697 family)
MESISLKDNKKILICLTLYITSLFASNTLGLKLMPFIFGSHLSVGVFCFPIVFIMTDVIGEVYGKKMAKQFVLAGAISIILFLTYSFISALVPWAKEGLWARSSWNLIFGLTARISIASLAAFAFAEYQDVVAFFFFKKYTGQKHFWIRSNLSNLWSQLLDTIIFMTIAFLGVYPPHTLFNIIISWWLFKVVMGFVYTPLSYLGIYILRDRNGIIESKKA